MGAFRGRTAILSLTDIREDRFLISKSAGIEPHQLRDDERHLPEIHALLAQALATRPSLDEPSIVSRHMSRAYVEASPCFQECVSPYGIVNIMQYFLMHTSTRLAGLGISRHERQGIITEREIELGGLLLPHLRRAVTISNVLDAVTVERERMAETLDALRCGVVLTNDRGAILHANRSAEEMLRNGGPVEAIRGVLRAKTPAAAKELGTAIMLAARGGARIGKAGLAVRLTELDERLVFAHVLPLTGSDLRTRLQPPAVAAVFIGAAQDAQDAADIVAAAYGLTRTETQVLASLLAGHTLAEIAINLRIAVSTAKTHLDNIFLKTGVCRQAELIRLAIQAVPPPGR
ncbi:MAG: hypothetical protein EOR81_32430 [Mesorhizobium sp.]|nr:MAG: hypothetical protein EOR81_32430 [Mesorhizobium sp.]